MNNGAKKTANWNGSKMKSMRQNRSVQKATNICKESNVHFSNISVAIRAKLKQTTIHNASTLWTPKDQMHNKNVMERHILES